MYSKLLGIPPGCGWRSDSPQANCVYASWLADIDVDFSTISKHLAILKQAGVVGSSEKRGKQVYYHLKVACIINLMPCVETVIEAFVCTTG